MSTDADAVRRAIRVGISKAEFAEVMAALDRLAAAEAQRDTLAELAKRAQVAILIGHGVTENVGSKAWADNAFTILSDLAAVAPAGESA